jgi:tetratricopeptide (TPR) repeat protein
MTKRLIFGSVIATLLSFVGGFLIANTLNRGEIQTLRSENERFRATVGEVPAFRGGDELSPAEIAAKIEEADRNPDNAQFQKDLGTALYQYSAMRRDSELLDRAIKLLERAHALSPKDREAIVSLGNAHFVGANLNAQPGRLPSARSYYLKALELGPDDVELRSDLALTYFLQEPPDLDASVKELESALAIDPKHQRSLQFLVQALWKAGKANEAGAALDRLRQADPQDRSIPELTALLTRAPPK